MKEKDIEIYNILSDTHFCLFLRAYLNLKFNYKIASSTINLLYSWIEDTFYSKVSKVLFSFFVSYNIVQK